MRKLIHEEFVEELLIKNEHYAKGDFTLTSRYNGSKQRIGCHCNIHNHDWTPIAARLPKGGGCPMCGNDAAAKKRTIPKEEFVRRLNEQVPGVSLVGEYIDMVTRTQFQCEKKHIWTVTPNNVLCTLRGCPYCSGRKTLIGFNDMWTTRPDLARMLTNPEDGYKYTYGSNKKTWFNCPNCGTPGLKTINNVSSHDFGCQHCSDGISYPNKFSRALLDQLPIDSYDCEYQPKWAEPYFYDNHFWYKDVEYILEMDGNLHFNQQTFSRNTLAQIQNADCIKDELAKQHNIHMIRIDCVKSDMEYIKSHILNSELNNIFDLSNIDWDLCDKRGQKNILKEACNLYMSKTYTLTNIGEILGVHPATVSNYLKKGSKFGWCDYVVFYKKPIDIIDDIGNIIYSFDSITSCIIQMKKQYNVVVYSEGIRNSCNTHKPYKGFNFRYAKEIQQND